MLFFPGDSAKRFFFSFFLDIVLSFCFDHDPAWVKDIYRTGDSFSCFLEEVVIFTETTWDSFFPVFFFVFSSHIIWDVARFWICFISAFFYAWKKKSYKKEIVWDIFMRASSRERVFLFRFGSTWGKASRLIYETNSEIWYEIRWWIYLLRIEALCWHLHEFFWVIVLQAIVYQPI